MRQDENIDINIISKEFEDLSSIKNLKEALSKPINISFGPIFIPSKGLRQEDYKQYRFPRSKKKRIRFKWRRNPFNWRTSVTSYIIEIPTITPMRFIFGDLDNI